jgi:hypothetical protein
MIATTRIAESDRFALTVWPLNGSRCKVLPTGGKGFGLFAGEAIDLERFVAQYMGGVITMSEC